MVDAPVAPLTGAENVVWDLSTFYQSIDDPALERDMAGLRERAEQWAATYRGRVARLSAPEMVEALRRYEDLMDTFGRINAFIFLTYTTDTTNPRYGALLQKLMEYSAEIEQILLFFELEWNEADDEAVNRLLSDTELGKYRHFLEAERRFKPHKLSEAEEKLLVEKDVTGRGAWLRLFTQMMGAMRFDLDGEKLTDSQIFAKLHEPDRDLRRRAADAITAGLAERAPELTFIFNVLAADKAADDRRRGYSTWISSRNLSNKAKDETVEALVQAVTSRYDIVARHYTLKRKILGYDTLYDYDRYAPLPLENAGRSYPWDEARAIVEQAYTAFSPSLGTLVRRFFDERWIHAALAPGKRSGAFASATVPSAHPFVFLNYTGKANDVKTLAHELGHGVHMALAAEKQGYLGMHTPLTTAEMASVFGEMLVFDDLMRREPDPAARLVMQAQTVEDSLSTIFRQVAMNRFEDRLHNARRAEGELAADRISDLWMETQRAMFQGSVTMRDEYRLWWSYIPHFLHTPGYVYAYAFGKLLVLALFNLYKARGADFVPQYLDVLAAGDSDYPEAILSKVGVDLADPNFWHEGLDAVAAMVDQEEALAREIYPDRVQAAASDA